jgi:hypothetical protein
MTRTVYEKVNQLTTNLMEDVRHEFRGRGAAGVPEPVDDEDYLNYMFPNIKGLYRFPGSRNRIIQGIGTRRGAEQLSKGGLEGPALGALSTGAFGAMVPSFFDKPDSSGSSGKTKSKLGRIGNLLTTVLPIDKPGSRLAGGLAGVAGGGAAGFDGLPAGLSIAGAFAPAAVVGAIPGFGRTKLGKSTAIIGGGLGALLGGEAGREFEKEIKASSRGGDPYKTIFNR